MFLLRSNDAMTVTDVCMAVGFSSLGTFSRVFTAVVGEPPSVYRRRGLLGPVPTCFAMAWLRRGLDTAGSAKPRSAPNLSLAGMLNSISISQIFVPDQDAALQFYVDQLGFEVQTDMAFGPMRVLTVALPSDPGHAVLLEKPGPPGYSEEIAAQVRDLVSKAPPAGTSSSPRRTRTGPTPNSRSVASISPRNRRCSPTGSTSGSGIRPATTSGSLRWRLHRHRDHGRRTWVACADPLGVLQAGRLTGAPSGSSPPDLSATRTSRSR